MGENDWINRSGMLEIWTKSNAHCDYVMHNRCHWCYCAVKACLLHWILSHLANNSLYCLALSVSESFMLRDVNQLTDM